MTTRLLQMEPLEKTVQCCLLSPYIQNEKPLSLLIVAKPESGKTSIMKKYSANGGVCYLTDCTAYGLTRDVLPKIVNGETKTLMIADLLTPLARSSKTRKNFVAFLNNLIEEGLAKITTYATVWDKAVTTNVITAVTDSALNDGRREWANMGFLSRFLIFSYSYPLSIVYEILEHYSADSLQYKDVKMKMPKKIVNIELSSSIASQLNPFSMSIGQSMGLYGIRAKINFRVLLKAIALNNNHNTVTGDDFKEFLSLSTYFNLNYNPFGIASS